MPIITHRVYTVCLITFLPQTFNVLYSDRPIYIMSDFEQVLKLLK